MVRNRCTTSTFDNKEIPYEKFTGKTVDYKFLKTFGCAAYVYVPLVL